MKVSVKAVKKTWDGNIVEIRKDGVARRSFVYSEVYNFLKRVKRVEISDTHIPFSKKMKVTPQQTYGDTIKVDGKMLCVSGMRALGFKVNNLKHVYVKIRR